MDMADEPNEDELLLDQPLEPDEDEQREDDEDQQDTNVNDEADQGEEEEVLTFGDDTDHQVDDSSTIKHLRDELKRARKEAIEARSTAPKEEPVEVGPKPTMEGCGYDEDEFETQLDAWKERQRQADDRKTQAQKAEEAERKEWEGELSRYNEGKAKLGFTDVDDAEETIKTSLDPVQQAVLVKAADDPAKVMYALAKHPDRLTQIAAIRDPLKLAAAIAKLEGQLKVVKRRKAPEPDTPERGSAKVSHTGADKQLEKLEQKANKTGDRTELIAYRKQMKTGKKA